MHTLLRLNKVDHRQAATENPCLGNDGDLSTVSMTWVKRGTTMLVASVFMVSYGIGLEKIIPCCCRNI
jgi:hypothetical protein